MLSHARLNFATCSRIGRNPCGISPLYALRAHTPLRSFQSRSPPSQASPALRAQLRHFWGGGYGGTVTHVRASLLCLTAQRTLSAAMGTLPVTSPFLLLIFLPPPVPPLGGAQVRKITLDKCNYLVYNCYCRDGRPNTRRRFSAQAIAYL